MATKTRTKVKNVKKQEDKVKLTPVRVRPDEVRAGDLIVTKFRRQGERKEDWRHVKTQEDVADMFKHVGDRVIERTEKARDLELCAGRWRSHVHINGSCYDCRHEWVWIAVPEEKDVDGES